MQSPLLSPLKSPPPSERHHVVLAEQPPATAAANGNGAPPGGALGAGAVPLSRAIERRTLRRGMTAATFEGLHNGLASMSTYVAIKGMGQGFERWEELISTLMQMLPSVLMAFALVWSAGRRARKHRGYWLFVAVFGRLALFSVALFANPFLFVALVAYQSIVGSGIAPGLNHIWGANLSQASRGRVFTWISIAAEIATMAGALIAGVILDGLHFDGMGLSIHTDGEARNYVYVYPAAALIGFAAMMTYWRIRIRFAPASVASHEAPRLSQRLKHAWQIAAGLMKRDPDFRLYELGFFLYGSAFMMTSAVVPLFFKNALQATYKDFSLATVVLVQVMHLLAAPLIARYASKRRVTVVTRVPFVMLMGYPVLLTVTALVARENREAAIPLVYAAFALFGVAMALIHFVWSLGPVAFARGQDSLPYTSTHAALVGFRASIGFPVAFVLMQIFPDEPLPIFGLSFVLFFCGAVAMTVLDRRLKARAPGGYSMTG
ncbi:MAG: MFS transporter [Planctomycetes bacterium]|nr:MFS transporter [Planctomycetota bacterium]